MHLRHLPIAGLLAALAASSVLTGCGGDDTAGDGPTSSPSPSATPSPSPSDTPTPSDTPSSTPSADPTRLPTSQLEAAALHTAVLDSSVARTAEQKAVVAAWMRYWQAAADTYYYAKEDPALARSATGEARASVVRYMRQKKAARNRIVGWARDNVTDVRVDGSRATVRDCTKNYTFTIDEEGEPVTRPDPWYDATGQLAKSGGTWKVVSLDSPARRRSCLD